MDRFWILSFVLVAALAILFGCLAFLFKRYLKWNLPTDHPIGDSSLDLAAMPTASNLDYPEEGGVPVQEALQVCCQCGAANQRHHRHRHSSNRRPSFFRFVWSEQRHHRRRQQELQQHLQQQQQQMYQVQGPGNNQAVASGGGHRHHFSRSGLHGRANEAVVTEIEFSALPPSYDELVIDTDRIQKPSWSQDQAPPGGGGDQPPPPCYSEVMMRDNMASSKSESQML